MNISRVIPEDQYVRCSKCSLKMGIVNICCRTFIQTLGQKEQRVGRCNKIVCPQCKHCKECRESIDKTIQLINNSEGVQRDSFTQVYKDDLRHFYDFLV
jgi:hypothetical protein